MENFWEDPNWDWDSSDSDNDEAKRDTKRTKNGYLADPYLLMENGMRPLIKKNSVHLALVQSIKTPGEFYVVLEQVWNQLEGIMATLQEECRRMDIVPGKLAVPWRGHLIPGYIILAKCTREEEYHRAKILEVLPNRRYKVRLLDYGDTHEVAYKDIRYLRIQHYYSLRTQGIRCRMSMDCVKSWTTADGDLFRDMVFDREIAIRFKNMSILEDGEVVWDVVAHLYRKNFGRITGFHLERHIVERSGKKLTLSPEEEKETETDPRPKISIVDPEDLSILKLK